MGLFDIFKGKGGANDERALMRHAERVMDKRAMSPDRFASIEYLARLGTPEAWRALLPRYNFNVDPSITDREEKNFIFEAVKADPENAVEPLKEYLHDAQSVTWPIKMLRILLPREELVTELLEVLGTFDTGYEKNVERKTQIVMELEEETDPRVPAAVAPFLEDFSEDVRFHAIRTLLAQGDESVSGQLYNLLMNDTSMRIRTTAVDGLAERGWAMSAEQRDPVGKLLLTVPTGPWVVNGELKIARPGAK
jgi:HEAT repeat protein